MQIPSLTALKFVKDQTQGRVYEDNYFIFVFSYFYLLLVAMLHTLKKQHQMEYFVFNLTGKRLNVPGPSCSKGGYGIHQANHYPVDKCCQNNTIWIMIWLVSSILYIYALNIWGRASFRLHCSRCQQKLKGNNYTLKILLTCKSHTMGILFAN